MKKLSYKSIILCTVLFFGTVAYAKPSPFLDVDTYNFSRVAITYLQQEGIVTGKEDGSFYPASAITRAEFAALLLRSAKIPVHSGSIVFKDVPEGAWYRDVIQTAYAEGVMSGYPNGHFAPEQEVTTAEAAAMLLRVFPISQVTSDEFTRSDMERGVWYTPYLSTLLAYNIDPFVTQDNIFPNRMLSRSEAAELLFRTLAVYGEGAVFSDSLVNETDDMIYISRKGVARGQQTYLSSLSQEEQKRIALLDRATAAVVSIVGTVDRTDLENYLKTLAKHTEYNQRYATLAFDVTHGTGFFVTKSGLVATNKHVVEENIEYNVLTKSGESFRVKKVYKDDTLDFALLELDMPLTRVHPFLELLAAKETALIGQDTYTIGNPLGRYPESIGEGIITGLGRTLKTVGSGSKLMRLFDALQTNAEISRGNSGGPLIDRHGQVLGMATALDDDGENLGFAIDHDYLIAAIDSFKKYGEFHKAYLGIRYVALDTNIAKSYGTAIDYGAYILSSSGTPAVEIGSPAERAGLQEEDIIISVEGVALGTMVELSDQLALYRMGERVVLQVQRGTQLLTIPVLLDSKPVIQ